MQPDPSTEGSIWSTCKPSGSSASACPATAKNFSGSKIRWNAATYMSCPSRTVHTRLCGADSSAPKRRMDAPNILEPRLSANNGSIGLVLGPGRRAPRAVRLIAAHDPSAGP
jgi:hypothetical protein